MPAVRFNTYILSSGGIRIAPSEPSKILEHGGKRDEVHDGGGRPVDLDGLWKIFGAPASGPMPCSSSGEHSGNLSLPVCGDLAGSLLRHSENAKPSSSAGAGGVYFERDATARRPLRSLQARTDEKQERANNPQPTTDETFPAKSGPIKTLLSKEEKQIRAFIGDSSRSTLQLSSIKNKRRGIVDALVASYCLECEYDERGNKWTTTLTKTTKTRSILESPQASQGRGGEEQEGCGPIARAPRRHHEGEVVGKHAARITDENVGYKLPQNIRWSEGSRIGARASGPQAPLEVVVKRSKRGPWRTHTT